MLRSLQVVVLVLFFHSSVLAQLVARWRFEELAEGTPLSIVQDSSGCGNDLHAFNADTSPGISKDVPFDIVPQTHEKNAVSLDNTAPPGRNMPTRDLFCGGNDRGFELNTSAMEQWTIEVCVKIKPIDGWEKRFETFVGRDGYNVANAGPLDESPLASLGFKKRGDNNKFSIEAWDSAGQYVVVQSKAPAKAEMWYSLAAVSDGKTLSLWIKTDDDRQYVKQAEAPFSGAMANSRGGFCVGRGVFASQPTEQFFGWLDELRISAQALSPEQFLASPSAVATVPTTQPRTASQDATIPATASATIPTTSIRVHDPAVISDGKAFHLFASHEGLIHYRSTDLVHWDRVASALDSAPQWAREAIGSRPGLWAPCMLAMNQQYYLYYSISQFGSQRSAIGLLTSPSLEPAAGDYAMLDKGKVIESFRGDDFNAIDPVAIVDANGQPWLAWGSFCKGIFIIELDSKTGKVRDGAKPIQLAHRPKGNALEAPDLWYASGYYYLLASYDFCCRGAGSSYKLMVGRSRQITGPYKDREGRPMLEGFASLLVRGYYPFNGPGHSSLITKDGRPFVAHHYYDARQFGVPTLAVRPLYFDDDNWPLVGEPIGEVRAPASSLAGEWVELEDDANPSVLTINADGTLVSRRGNGSWKLHDDQVVLLRERSGKSAMAQRQTRGVVSGDFNSIIARNADGSIFRARRVIK